MNKTYDCPLKGRKDCRWTGPYSGIKRHCEQCHVGDTRQLIQNEITILNFYYTTYKQTHDKRYNFPFLLKVGEDLFQLEWDFLPHVGIIRWFMVHLGNYKSTWSFSVTFPSIDLEVGSECQKYMVDHFDDVRFAYIDSTELEPICNEGDGDLSFYLYVYKNVTNNMFGSNLQV